MLVLVVCVIALSLAYPLREYAAQRAEIAQLREEQARMRESVEELSLREQALGREEYIESEARARLHYQYPGETAYIVIRPEDEDGDEDVSGPRDPWFEVLWRSVEEADGR
ncbi:septum formation initiator family protein [Nocardiopsis algeriensis]|uniref:FtsB family cell division protein n=1 Tax=Nocardiopsis algeriensis TaxID=1478215 RepID=UPI0031B571D1